MSVRSADDSRRSDARVPGALKMRDWKMQDHGISTKLCVDYCGYLFDQPCSSRGNNAALKLLDRTGIMVTITKCKCKKTEVYTPVNSDTHVENYIFRVYLVLQFPVLQLLVRHFLVLHFPVLHFQSTPGTEPDQFHEAFSCNRRDVHKSRRSPMQALTGDVYLIAGNGSVHMFVVSEQMITDSVLSYKQ